MLITGIREVQSHSDWNAFLSLPWKIFENDPYWVPPLLMEQKSILNKKKNPYFKHCTYKAWTIYKDGDSIGRILAYIDSSHNSLYKEQTGFLGFFECINDQATVEILFNTAIQWLNEEGMSKVYGPMNFSIANECGVLLNGFDSPPVLQMNHTPSYYSRLFENAGFVKAHDLFAYQVTEDIIKRQEKFVKRLQQLSEAILKKEGIIIRKINLDNYEEELENVNTLFNSFMKDTWGFVPSSIEEMKYSSRSLKSIADQEMIYMAEVNNKVVGCSLSIPDFNEVLKHMNGRLLPTGIFKVLWYRNKIKGLRLILLGITHEYRNLGLDIVFYYYTIINGLNRGYNKAELSWISEDNSRLISIIEKFGATRYKTYRMFKKDI